MGQGYKDRLRAPLNSPEFRGARARRYERAYAKLLEQSSGIPHLDPRSNGAMAAGN